MAFSVIWTSESLVRPSEQTPSTVLDLSAIDRLPVLRGNARSLHVYRHGQEVTKVIKEALSKALVPYYPLAGRLKESSSGQLQVECSGEGVWLLEAYANCILDSVNYFDDVTCNSTYEELLPAQFPAETQGTDPLVQMQVTEFECGGFVLGIKFSHSICDGFGSAQFLNAVGEMARGLEHLSITPAWARNFFKSPSKGQQLNLEAIDAPISPPPPAMPNYKLEHANVDISMDRINGMKKEFQEATGRHCSAFEVVAATLWTCRTRAVNLDQNNNNNEQVKLVFFANCRHILDPPLPRGFYGNCFFPVTITASSDTIARASIADVVKLIQEAKAKLPQEFSNYIANRSGVNRSDPYAPPLSYATLFVSEWGRLGFNQLDFGWGPPVHVVPIQGSSVIPAGIVGWLPRMLPRSDSRDQQGIRLVTWCVEETHRQTFIDHIMRL